MNFFWLVCVIGLVGYIHEPFAKFT
ncbi:hypothetical protein PMI08_02001, partial [Brevibacillus sp. CF112]